MTAKTVPPDRFVAVLEYTREHHNIDAQGKYEIYTSFDKAWKDIMDEVRPYLQNGPYKVSHSNISAKRLYHEFSHVVVKVSAFENPVPPGEPAVEDEDHAVIDFVYLISKRRAR